MGGASASEGRVEFCNSGQWGTVCDDIWGTADAQVVCRQLGLVPTGKLRTVYFQCVLAVMETAGALAIGRASFGQGTGPIILDDVNCRGSELRLDHCPANPIGVHNCVHSSDAGVRCLSKL